MNTQTPFALVAVLSCILVPLANPQTNLPKQTGRQPGLQELKARFGAVLIKGFSKIGAVKGDGGDIHVRAIERFDLETGEKARGIELFFTARSGSYTQIDYDEIGLLTKAIDRLASLDKSITELEQFEAVYRTRANMTVSLGTPPLSRDIIAVLDPNTTGGGGIALSLDRLKELGQLINEAEAKIKSLKID